MSLIEWIVIIGGLTAMAWVNWYFFFAQAVEEKRGQQNTAQHPASTR